MDDLWWPVPCRGEFSDFLCRLFARCVVLVAAGVLTGAVAWYVWQFGSWLGRWFYGT